MSVFEKTVPNFRLAQTHWGDDLQAIAQREMGDANRWPELIWLNGLLFPYLTSDPAVANDNVLMYGALIKVPAPVGVYTDTADKGQVYERDCAMVGKKLTADAKGDFAVVAGAENLKQQLKHRVDTPRGQARRHPDYGCLAWSLIGSVNGPVAAALAAKYVRATIQSDYRVARVNSSSAEVVGDALRVSAQADGIAGGAVDVTALS